MKEIDVTKIEEAPMTPADHILDEFLAKRSVAVSWAEFSEVLGKIRSAVLAEATPRPVVDRDALIKVFEASATRGETVIGREFVEGWADEFADAVLALINGTTTPEPVRPSEQAVDNWRGQVAAEVDAAIDRSES